MFDFRGERQGSRGRREGEEGGREGGRRKEVDVVTIIFLIAL